MENLCDIKLLANLLKPPRDGEDTDSESDNEHDSTENMEDKSNELKKSLNKKNIYEKLEPEKLQSEEDILKSEDDAILDSRKKPEVSITYRQAVTPEDIYLQMGAKSPCTASCEDMIVTIDLPDEQRQSLDLNITSRQLDLTSPKYKLNMPLPQPIDPQRSSAKWDSKSEKLILTLRMDREFDFINF